MNTGIYNHNHSSLTITESPTQVLKQEETQIQDRTFCPIHTTSNKVKFKVQLIIKHNLIKKNLIYFKYMVQLNMLPVSINKKERKSINGQNVIRNWIVCIVITSINNCLH